MFYVYIYSHPVTKVPFYVGKGTGTRYKKHLSETKENTENYKKWAVIEGLRNKGMEPLIEKVFETNNEEDAYNEETRLIMLYGRRDIDNNGILTNICNDIKPPKRSVPLTEEHKKKISKAHIGHTAYNPNYKHSEETKKKIGLANKGKASRTGKLHSEATKKKIKESNKASVTEERRAQMSLLKKGKTFSNEHKKKLSAAHTGRKMSEETKQKIREAHLKRKNK
jgi:hypothetical protein